MLIKAEGIKQDDENLDYFTRYLYEVADLADKVVNDPDEALVSRVLGPVRIADAIRHIGRCQRWECVGVALDCGRCILAWHKALPNLSLSGDCAFACPVYHRGVDAPVVIKSESHSDSIEAKHPAGEGTM